MLFDVLLANHSVYVFFFKTIKFSCFGKTLKFDFFGTSGDPTETFARFQACFLSSEDLHNISDTFIAFHDFSFNFNEFSLIFMDFRAWGLSTIRNDLLMLLLLDSRLVSCPLKTFTVFHEFIDFSCIFTDFYRLS